MPTIRQTTLDELLSFSARAIANNQADCPQEKIDTHQWGAQVKAVYDAMLSGRWMTKAEIAFHSGSSEHGVSARLSDLKKKGILTEKRKARDSNFYEYRLIPN